MGRVLTRCGLEDDQVVSEETRRLVENLPMKILVIEDEVRLAEYLRKGLSESGYVVDLARATRQSPSLQLGVSPRGATALMSAARAWAWLSGRDYVTPDDVKALARPALRHRVELRAEAELEGVTADAVLDGVLGTVPVPR